MAHLSEHRVFFFNELEAIGFIERIDKAIGNAPADALFPEFRIAFQQAVGHVEADYLDPLFRA
jgi:hypothetical protein